MKKIILLFIIGVVLLGFVGATETFTPIFCNDYEFTCCNEKTEVTSSHEVSDEAPWTCPSYAYKCYILSLSKDNINSYVGSNLLTPNIHPQSLAVILLFLSKNHSSDFCL